MKETRETLEETLVHATCVALNSDAGGLAGILLFGPTGAGKSDLALRLIDQGARLVSDDQTRIKKQAEQLMAAPPETLAGRIEIRGLGIVTLPFSESVRLTACFNLMDASHIERMPEPKARKILGISLPCLDLFPFEASATAKLRLAVREMSGFIMDQD
jgi:serine kinase of HPr protein (carbohydrate metabolism regulator)